ncbi:ABC transporter permease [Pusillimonas sp. CC-YST705]|uniref:Transport permease protein n=1 Tax=Mesopusillimonas faecipullorum TaxID=2755040 RepID=A0ABS8CAL0_9BURK|nr:ABC transporter permease [Mesopusillimonas faecipullorum]MCB5363028.1 ABC transporter permease [Mesopusillimonas faecipullorum]
MKKRSSLKVTQAVLLALVIREVRARLYARRFGALWLILEPIVHIAGILAFVTVIRGRTVPGFDAPIFFFVGIAPFLMMRNICLRMMEAVSANQALFAYRQIKPLDTMLARLLVEVALAGCVYALILFGMAVFLNYDIGIAHPLEWVWVLLVGIIFSFSVGVILCVIVEIVPELKGFLRMMFLPLYFISGVLFPIWLIPNYLLKWIEWNPFLYIIDNLRRSIFIHYPDVPSMGMEYPVKLTVCCLFLAMGLYRARHLRLVAL